jgi:hypothetical protein
VAVVLVDQVVVLGIRAVVVVHNLDKHKLFVLQYIQVVPTPIVDLAEVVLQAAQVDPVVEQQQEAEQMPLAVLDTHGLSPVIYMAVEVAQPLFSAELVVAVAEHRPLVIQV